MDVPTFSLYIIIASRVIQALGGGAMVPVGMALTVTSTPWASVRGVGHYRCPSTQPAGWWVISTVHRRLLLQLASHLLA
jgi:MFS family permease